MSPIRSKSLNLPEEVPFVPKTGRGRTEYISVKPKSFYGELRGKLNRFGLRTGKSLKGRFGRGSSRGQGSTFRQRVTVKARFQKNKPGSSHKGLRKHVSYLTREGVSQDGGPAGLFNEKQDLTREESFNITKEWANDRHHWRIIVSPEKGDDLDLNQFAKDFIDGMEKDLATKLQWIGAAHYDTENPHIHLLIRGRTDTGEDLVLKPGYVSHGLRDLGEELATNKLGLRKEWELEKELIESVTKERFCLLDKRLLFEASTNTEGQILLTNLKKKYGNELTNLKIKRLKFLKELGLSKRISMGKWQVANSLQKVLKNLSIKDDIIKTMHAKMAKDKENVFFEPGRHVQISGKVIHKGYSDPLADKTFLLLEGMDGKNYYIFLSRYSEKEGSESRIGDTVTVTTEGFKLKKIDQIISDIAKNNTQKNEATITLKTAIDYLNQNPSLLGKVSAEAYVKNLERRLLALQKKGIIKSNNKYSFTVPQNLEEKIKAQTVLHAKVVVEKERPGTFKGRGL